MSDPLVAPVAPILNALRALPLWLFAGLALAGYAILFVPGFAEIDPAGFRREWGVWVWVSTLVFTVLAVARAIASVTELVSERRKNNATKRILRIVPLHRQCWWHLAKQKDGSFLSQISVDVQLTNTTNRPVQVVKLSLVRPRAKLIQANILLPMAGSPYHSDRYPVPAHGTVTASTHIMVRAVLAKAGRPIRITIAVTDQFGEEYKIKNIRVETHDRPAPPQTLADRIRRVTKVFSQTAVPATQPMPWSYRAGSEYIQIAENILQEEKRSYAANGRERGGLGTLNVKIQSEPRSSGGDGTIPTLLWPKGQGKTVSSPNLDRMLRLHEQLVPEDRTNLQQFLLSQLSKESAYRAVGYFVFLVLHRLGRSIDALKTARTFLAGDSDYGYSNILGALSAVVSHEHWEIDPQFFPAILEALAGDEEHDFSLKENITSARLEHLDRAHAEPAS